MRLLLSLFTRSYGWPSECWGNALFFFPFLGEDTPTNTESLSSWPSRKRPVCATSWTGTPVSPRWRSDGQTMKSRMRTRGVDEDRQPSSLNQWANARAPSRDLLRRADEILLRRFHLQLADRQDVIAQALLDYLRAPTANSSSEGLFLTILRRRACDFWRKARREEPISAEPSYSEEYLEETNLQVLQRVANQFFAAKAPSERRRAKHVLAEIVDGASLTEACQIAGISRSSRRRYRYLLQECFREVLHPLEISGPPSPLPGETPSRRRRQAGRRQIRLPKILHTRPPIPS